MIHSRAQDFAEHRSGFAKPPRSPVSECAHEFKPEINAWPRPCLSL